MGEDDAWNGIATYWEAAFSHFVSGLPSNAHLRQSSAGWATIFTPFSSLTTSSQDRLTFKEQQLMKSNYGPWVGGDLG